MMLTEYLHADMLKQHHRPKIKARRPGNDQIEDDASSV